MTDLDVIEQLRPDVPLAGPGELRLTRSRLARAMAAEAGSAGHAAGQPANRPRGRGRALAVGGAAVIALAAGVAVAVAPARPATHGRPGGTARSPLDVIAGTQPPRTAAARLLARIADAATRQPASGAGDNQYEYVKSLEQYEVYVTRNGKTTTYMPRPEIRQWWQSVSNLCRDSLILEDGSYERVSDRYPGKCPEAGSVQGGDPTYRLMQSLPTNPHTLLRLIYAADQALVKEAKLPPGQSFYAAGQSAYSFAFDDIGEMLNDEAVPPQFSAALYRAAALIPGVTVLPDAVNAAGQHGVAVTFAYSGQREEWIFSKDTLQYIGQRDVDARTGAVTGNNAILAEGFVDRAGEVPGRHG